MYKKVPNGSVERIYEYDCQIPPVGYGVNVITGELEYIGVQSSSSVQANQIWKRIPLPDDYEKKAKEEEKRQVDDPDYIDIDLENYRQQQWKHRLCGCWFKNNGKDTYITNVHWYYLNWCQMDIGFPHYRDNDRKYFYVWRYCEEDDRCGGLIHAARRREGKTYKGGAILLEYISRTQNSQASIVSKTANDAKMVFQKAVVGVFKKMPPFFMPVFDTSKGVTPTSELRFNNTTIKGKKALEVLKQDELNSSIDWKSSDLFACDGTAQSRHYEDEVGKTLEVNVYDRWQVNRFCLDQDGFWKGKAALSTTVEEMESGGEAFKKLWMASDVNKRDPNGRTESGLYRLFIPAQETTFFDKYGIADIPKGSNYYQNQREGLKNDPRALSSIIRKNPMSEADMFRIDGDRCLFNSMKLNEQLDYLTWNNDIVQRGNFVWENGEKDTKVIWEKNKHGRWHICWLPDKEGESNNIGKNNGIFTPNNKHKYIAAVDPYDHSNTSDTRRSMAASFVLKKNDPLGEDVFNKTCVAMYFARPDTAPLMFEDILKQCVYFGCPLLFENNKPGIGRYFADRGYERFLVKLPKYNDYGIPSTPENKQTMAELIEDYVQNNVSKIYYKDLIQQLLEFEIKETQKYDLVMAFGYCLIADMSMVIKKRGETKLDITDFFRR